MSTRSRNYDITPAMIDVLVVLAGAGREAIPAEHICITGELDHIGKVLAGLKNRGLITEGAPTYAFRYPHTRQRTWRIRWEGIPDPLWGRIMVDWCRRHDTDIHGIMTEDDLKRCEVAA